LFGQRNTQTPNEPNGMVIRYYLKTESASKATITITDSKGQQVARLTGAGASGINTVVWSTRDRGDEGRGGAGRGTAAGTGGGGAGGGERGAAGQAGRGPGGDAGRGAAAEAG